MFIYCCRYYFYYHNFLFFIYFLLLFLSNSIADEHFLSCLTFFPPLKLFTEYEQEVPENKRRVSMLKGIVIARRNAGLNSTFRIRRLVAGVGVESVFPM